MQSKEKNCLHWCSQSTPPCTTSVVKPEELFVYLCSELWLRDLAEKYSKTNQPKNYSNRLAFSSSLPRFTALLRQKYLCTLTERGTAGVEWRNKVAIAEASSGPEQRSTKAHPEQRLDHFISNQSKNCMLCLVCQILPIYCIKSSAPLLLLSNKIIL